MSKQILAFKAPWCGPCKQMEPIINNMKAEGFKIDSLDVEDNVELAKQYNVRAVPTFVVLEGGIQSETIIGIQSKEALVNIFKN